METSVGLKIFAAVVAVTIPLTTSLAHADDDISRSEELFALCGACYGLDGKGVETLKAPGLVNEADWYSVAQLKSLRSGMRGTHQSDLTGMQMRPMSPTLLDDQALRDVAAYIRTLRQ
jgi:cytochrome c oxidase subunit 2